MAAVLIQESTLQGIADEIRNKLGSSDEYYPAEMPAAIASISSGIDTSDADATATDIASGKTAYANGEKITGTLIPAGTGAYVWRRYASVWAKTTVNKGLTKPDDCGSANYSAWSISADGYYTLSGNSYLSGYRLLSGETNGKTKKLYYASFNALTGETSYYLWTLADNPTQGDTLLGYVSSDSESAYPDNGTQDGYWYVKVTEGTGGTDTSDADAAAADILSGKTAYVNGEKITGTLETAAYYTGTTEPDATLGAVGDLYLMLEE